LVIKRQGEILKPIWTQKGELAIKLRDKLVKERDMLNNEYLNTDNFIKKFELCERLVEISKKLENNEKLIEYQNDWKILKEEIKNRKIKLEYYLKNVKSEIKKSITKLSNDNLHDGNYSDVYLNLFSFSAKLKNFAEPKICEKYHNLAKVLSNKYEFSNENISQVINEVLKINDDIEEYFI